MNLWLETNCSLVALDFERRSSFLDLKKQCQSMKIKLRQMNCIVTHTYIEKKKKL